MRYDYLENIIIKNSILDLRYFLNSLNFLKQLFLEEIGSIPLYDFKIKDGIFIQKSKYIFFDKIKPKFKISELSIIFSFKIFKIEMNKIIDILEILDNKNKTFLKLYINEKGFLVLEQTENIKLEIETKIKGNLCYFLCISIINDIFNNELQVFINTEDKIYHKKVNNLFLSKEFCLSLGKYNYFGIIGDFLIINKAIHSKRIKHLFNLNEDYANYLRKICYNFKILPKKNKLKYKYDYNNTKIVEHSKKFFKQLGFEIIFDMNPNDIIYNESKYKNIDIDNEEDILNINDEDILII